MNVGLKESRNIAIPIQRTFKDYINKFGNFRDNILYRMKMDIGLNKKVLDNPQFKN